jgi:arabinose-5-phosphate isomerase
MLLDDAGRLSGIFTDSDLARLLAAADDAGLDCPMSRVMTREPLAVGADTPMPEAARCMAERKISELPVLDAQRRPVGLIDITDIVGRFPDADIPQSEQRDRSITRKPTATLPFAKPERHNRRRAT